MIATAADVAGPGQNGSLPILETVSKLISI